MLKEIIKVWVDGACFPNPGKGGWAWTCLDGREDSGNSNYTTNQIMELTATIKAIESLCSENKKLLIFSDSLYVINGATRWYKSWITNGWKNSKKQPVANQDLWIKLLYLLKKTDGTSFQWVKGHSGNQGNEEADRLATLASKAEESLIKKCQKAWHSK